MDEGRNSALGVGVGVCLCTVSVSVAGTRICALQGPESFFTIGADILRISLQLVSDLCHFSSYLYEKGSYIIFPSLQLEF